MTKEQLAAHLDAPLWKIEAALENLKSKGLVREVTGINLTQFPLLDDSLAESDTPVK